LKFLRKYAANNVAGNTSYRFRQKRMQLLENFVNEKSAKNEKVLLDLGGTNYFWDNFKDFIKNNNLKLFIVNLELSAIKGYSGFVANVKNLSMIKSKSVDFVLSNSLIEHLGSFEEQAQFAKEVERISFNYFIQTPAFLFPLEPHFLFPFFHWLPKRARVFLITHFALGWFEKFSDRKEAETIINETRILKKKELKTLFPNSKIVTEFFFLFPKSYIIISK
jgi:hypothetical protein